ncbi:hypothetical protein PAEPH01_2011 [Pancytospora epiphaga]|nr:hypothetical protein PAEPH01_2011 [Pancytospora epiphaga]
MLAQLVIWILDMLCKEYKFVALLERDGALKSSKQISSHFKYVNSYFLQDIKDSLSESWNYDTFMYLDGKDLVAYGMAVAVDGVETVKSSFYWTNKKRRTLVISLYSLLVVEKYRGQGLCEKLVMEIVGFLKNKKNLPSDTLFTLHISPKDPLMHIAAKIYYRMGFTRGVFCKRGPSQFHYDIDYLFNNSYDLYKIMKEPGAARQQGGFITLYCRLENLGKHKSLPADCIIIGKNLKEFLEKRVENTPDSE